MDAGSTADAVSTADVASWVGAVSLEDTDLRVGTEADTAKHHYSFELAAL